MKAYEHGDVRDSAWTQGYMCGCYVHYAYTSGVSKNCPRHLANWTGPIPPKPKSPAAQVTP